MGGTDSKPMDTGAQGPMSNANSNSVTIIEKLENHKNTTELLLSLILAVMVLSFLMKIYTINKKQIKKTEQYKSRINLATV